MTGGSAKPLLWRILSPLTFPFVLVFALVVRIKNAAYDLGWIKSRQLSHPVLSVGNLSVGGTGKTPMVLLLAGLLESRGWSIDVISRGYGRSSRDVLRVHPESAKEVAVEVFGDEPLLMAQQGLSVYVGADRYQAGLLAERNAGSASRGMVHILDDGFQHRRLARTVDIVLVRGVDLEDDMLPAGRLREPLCALERADICVLRAEDADLRRRVLELMRRSDPARVWVIERRTVVSAEAKAAIAFCGIGDPQGFAGELRQAGVDVKNMFFFRDHHVYTEKDIERLKQAARSCGAKCFLTTEKDSVRLAKHMRAELEAVLPVRVAGLELTLQDEKRAMELLESLLREPLQTGAADVR